MSCLSTWVIINSNNNSSTGITNNNWPTIATSSSVTTTKRQVIDSNTPYNLQTSTWRPVYRLLTYFALSSNLELCYGVVNTCLSIYSIINLLIICNGLLGTNYIFGIAVTRTKNQHFQLFVQPFVYHFNSLIAPK